MMLRTTFVSAVAILALAACGDDTGGGTGGAGGDGTTSTSTGDTTSTTGNTTGNTTSGGEGGEGGGGTGDGGAGGGGTAFSAETYCADVTEACTGANAQYAGADPVATCLTAAATFETGEFQDTDNSLGCRAYHATAAASDPETHCVHAGPLGVGACSAAAESPCESFCAIADVVCGEVYGTVEACLKVCAGYDVGTYSAGDTPSEGDNLACRAYHLSVASIDEASAEIHCGHIAFESDTCF